MAVAINASSITKCFVETVIYYNMIATTIKRKKLLAIPLAGLGNRMRVLSSCMAIAKRDNRTLYVVWPVNAELGCGMNDIFANMGIDYKTPNKFINYILANIYRAGLVRRFFRLYKFLSSLFFDAVILDGDIIDYHVVNKLKKINKLNTKSTLLVASCLAFNDEQQIANFFDYLKDEPNRPQLNSFVFSDYINNRVNEEYNKIGCPYIGIHIRRTDNFNTIKYGEDANYIYEIEKCLAVNKEQKFFLATDSEKTKQFFKAKYGHRIHTVNSILERDSVEGIQAGVIEMLLLSKSEKIICSLISSYSNTAILIGKVKEAIYVDSFLKTETA